MPNMGDIPEATGDTHTPEYEVQRYTWGAYTIEVILDNCGRFVDINSVSLRQDFYDITQFIGHTNYFDIEHLYEDDESDEE